MAAPLPSVHRRRPSEWHSLRSRLPEGRSPWSTCCLPKSLHTPQINKWECEIPIESQRLKIEAGRSPVMVISTRLVRIQMHPHNRAIMHDRIQPPNSRSYTRKHLPTLLGRAICCCHAGIPGFRLRLPDPLMECSKIQSEFAMQNPALLGRDVRLKTPRGRFRSSTALAKLRNHLMRGFSKLQVLGCTCPRPVGW